MMMAEHIENEEFLISSTYDVMRPHFEAMDRAIAERQVKKAQRAERKAERLRRKANRQRLD